MKYIFLIGAVIFLFLCATLAEATPVTHVMAPDGDVLTDGWSRYPALANYYDKVDENSSDDDSTYVYTSSNGAEIEFSTGYRCPDKYQYTNHTASILVRAKYTGGATTRTITACFTYGEEVYEVDTVTLTSSYANYFFRLENHGSWNWADLDSYGLKFIASVQGFNAGIRITQALLLQNVTMLHASIALTSFTNGSNVIYIHNYSQFRTPNLYLNVTIDTYNWSIAGVGGVQNITCKFDNTYIIRQENATAFTGLSKTYAFGAYMIPITNETWHNLSIQFTEGGIGGVFNKFSTYRSYMFKFLMWLDYDLTPPQDPTEDPPPGVSGWKIISSGRSTVMSKYQLNFTNGVNTYTFNESITQGILPINGELFGFDRYVSPYYELAYTLIPYDGYWCWLSDVSYDIVDLEAGIPEEPIVITNAVDATVTNESSYSAPYWYIWVNASGDAGGGGFSGDVIINQPPQGFLLIGVTLMLPIVGVQLGRKKKNDN